MNIFAEQKHTLNTFIQHNFGSPSHGNQKKKRNKSNPNWKNK